MMAEQEITSIEDETVELTATVTFRWTYRAKPSDYGTGDPLEMAAIDREPTVAVEPSGTQRVNVVLITAGVDPLGRVAITKELRATFPEGGLVGAVNLVRAIPSVVCDNVSAADGLMVANRLRALGATVELRPAVPV